MDYLGFVVTSNFLKNPQPGNDMAFHRMFPFYGNLYIPKHWEWHGFSSTINLRGSEEYGKFLCLPILFLYYVNSLFPFLGVVWICTSLEILEKPITLECLFFPYFPRIMGIHFSHVLGIVWISASPKIYLKPITFKYLFFPILSPYYENSLSQYFGDWMDFCFTRNI